MSALFLFQDVIRTHPAKAMPRHLSTFVEGPTAGFVLYRHGKHTLVAPPCLDRYTRGNAVDLFPSDTASLQGILKDIAAASRKIQFESFLFNDKQGEAIANALIDRHRQGVKVEVILDAMAQKLDNEHLANKLKGAGIEVRYYNTRNLKIPPIAVDHVKIAIFDDKVAWEGGTNFDNEVNRDLMCRIQGPAVRDVQRVFANAWVAAGGRVEPLLPPPPPQGDVAIQITQTAPGTVGTHSRVLKKLRALRTGDRLDLWMMDLGDHEVLKEIVAAQKRGVQVRVLLDLTPPFIGKLGGIARESLRLLADGLPDLYAVLKLREAGVAVRYYKPPPGIAKLHNKVAIFTYHDCVEKPDGSLQRIPRQEVMTGSTNWTRGAFEFNHEVAAFMQGAAVGDRVQKFFEEDWNYYSLPFSTPKTLWAGAWQYIKSWLAWKITEKI